MRILAIFIPFLLFASVNITVNKKNLNAGEELIITISAEGKNIKFPNIKEIDGNKIVSTSTADNISIINGKMKEVITKSFILYPQKSLTIPSFTIVIDNKKYYTKPIHIKVTEPKKTKGNFELDVNISKNRLYLGESAILSLKFTKKANAASIQIEKPFIKNFLIKEINSKELKKENKEIFIYKFLLIPQKTGNYKVGPFIARVGTIVNQSNDFFGFQISNINYKNIYSNKLNIIVKPIPANSVYGDFNITITAKKDLTPNIPNKVTLKIKGCGDFYSLPDFKLNIKDATIYETKPKLMLYIKNNQLCGEYQKTFTILSDKSYIIPSIKLHIFDGKIKSISTPLIKVHIKNYTNNHKTTSNITQNNLTKIKNSNNQIIIIIVSLITGAILAIIILTIVNKIKKSEYLKIKKADEKELLNILKEFEDDKKIKEIMQKLEENIYKNSNNPINKNEIIKIIKNLRNKK